MRMRIVAAIGLALAAGLAYGQGLDDGEFLIDTGLCYVPAPGSQTTPAVAFDGTNYLTVWTDTRYPGGIYAARVTPQGAVLDPAGFAVCPSTRDSKNPAVAFDGTDYLVVWEDARGPDHDIYAARVTSQGLVLDSSGFAVSTAADEQGTPEVAFDGVNYLVVWRDFRNGLNSDIYAARVTVQGLVLDSSGIAVSTAAGRQEAPAVAFDGADFMVVWQDGRSGTSAYAARVTSQGAVLDTSGIAIPAGAGYEPTVAFDGTNCLVVWGSSSSSSIYGTRLTSQGIVLDSAGILVSRATSWRQSPWPVFDGTNFLVVWQDYRSGQNWDIYGARVSTQGAVLDSAGIAICIAANSRVVPAVAFDGANSLVIWEDERSGSEDIYGSRVTPEGAVLDSAGIAVASAAYYGLSPAAASDSTNYLVVWQDNRSDSIWHVYGARVSPQGALLDPAVIPVTAVPSDQRSPAVAFDGTNYLVVWRGVDNDSICRILAARLTPEGVLLDSIGLGISQGGTDVESAAVGFDGTNYLVVWSEFHSGTDYDINAARMTPGGTVLDSPSIAISAKPTWEMTPAVAFDGTSYLVVWSASGGTGCRCIFGARVTSRGEVLDTAAILIAAAGAFNDQTLPAVAFDGTNFLVAWQDTRGSGDIYAARVTPQGIVLDPSGITVCGAAGNQGAPSMCPDGAGTLVTWSDGRNGNEHDIYRARVTPGGVVFDSGPAVLQEGEQSYPALARGPGGQLFLAYESWTGTVADKTYNTVRVWGKLGPFPGVQETPNAEVRTTNAATIVRGGLFLAASGEKQEARGELLDVSGCRVLNLKPGANDVSRLSSGVYFVHERSAVGGERSTVHKVVLAQ